MSVARRDGGAGEAAGSRRDERAGDTGAQPEREPERVGSERTDERMARLLASGGRARELGHAVEALAEDGTDDGEAEDLRARLHALDFLDSLVGEVGSELPDRLGEFRLVGLLGRGGMGTVFEAFEESLERYVALKVLSPSLTTDSKMRKRFRTEARAAATLHHQHIVPVYGFGEAHGYLYFAMERVEGVSLDKLISRARREGRPAFAPRDAAQRFAGVADALYHAHRRGILHRDVKPGNILVHSDGELALADFGLSKIVGEQSGSVSQAGGFLGTLHYAAPEQAMGRPPGEASDLYSLGATLYEAITGRLPIAADSTEGLLHGIVHSTPPLLRRLVPDAPRDLEAVLQRLLAKEPQDRYPDGEALARDLQRVADDEPVHVRRLAWTVRAGRWIRKHPGLSGAIGTAIVLLATTAALFRLFRNEEQLGRQQRFGNLLTAAVAAAETEAGPVVGPGGLLSTLIGVELPNGSAGGGVLVRLDQAEALAPGGGQPARLRDAYLEDPAFDASERLRRGDGYGALQAVDARIDELEGASGFAQRDAETWLRLYRLYVTRAIARLTAAVADLDGAANDLLRASMIRPGAFLPRLLVTFLDWSPGAGVEDLLARVDAVAAAGPPEAPAAAAWILLAIAGRGRPAAAEMAEFELPSGDRRSLHDAAIERLRRLGTEVGPLAEGRGYVERVLADACGRILDAAVFGSVSTEAIAQSRRVLERQVAPTSPLMAWHEALARLEAPTGEPARDRAGRPLPPLRRLQGIELLLRLQPPSWMAEALRDQVERILEAAGPQLAATDAAIRVRALLASILDAPAAALQAADAWVALDPFDAAAYVCRFRCRLAAGQWSEAELDALVARQNAAEPAAVRERLARALRQLEPLEDRVPVDALERLRKVVRDAG
ncbi:MAG: serine/threonine protein kinase [Planctomycetes bacterium]|nr:serine/threonine protein kinase [Planctomycetota bacterium]